MAIDNFIPSIWSSKLLVSLKKELVFAQPLITNRDYQGEIADVGDTVKINAIGPITVSDYTKNGSVAAAQELTGAQMNLTVDQAKSFHFFVDDIDQAQQKPKVMSQAMAEAGYSLATATDTFLSTLMKNLFLGATATANQLGTTTTPKALTASTDAYNYLVDLKVILDMANVPQTGRWVVVPPWFEGNMLKDDRFVRAPISSPNTNVILNGQIRFAAGFNILSSNTIPFEGTGVIGEYYFVFAGTNMAATAVDQILKMEAYRPEAKFADAVKGLHVFGGSIVRPEALACLVVDRNA